MDQKKEILAAASRYCAITGLSRATLATRVMNDGKFFDRIEGDSGFTIKTYQKIKTWFLENPPKKKTKKYINTKHKSNPHQSTASP